VLLQVGTLSSFRLNVSHNALQRLELNATTGRGGEMSANVRVLDLSYNNVSCVVQSYLGPVERSLTHLHLSHNGLLNTTREVFGNMPHLQWLDLSSNKLAELDFDTFRNTRMLQVGAIMGPHDHSLFVQAPVHGTASFRHTTVTENYITSQLRKYCEEEAFMPSTIFQNMISHF
jgi:hypothetical protein